ncbi:MAG: hypothetical protein H8F28_26660 [Fibrella sp.]|nr:hypothetical protein [Armatimonadota bacterium]
MDAIPQSSFLAMLPTTPAFNCPSITPARRDRKGVTRVRSRPTIWQDFRRFLCLTFSPTAGNFEKLVKNANGTYTLAKKDLTVWAFKTNYSPKGRVTEAE